MADVTPCHEIIYSMMKMVDQYGWSDPGRKSFVSGKGTLRWQVDGATGHEKVMAYIPVRAAGSVKQFAVSIKIE